jgi:hypothetical protein
MRRASPQVRQASTRMRRASEQTRRAFKRLRHASAHVQRASPQTRRASERMQRASPHVRRQSPRMRHQSAHVRRALAHMRRQPAHVRQEPLLNFWSAVRGHRFCPLPEPSSLKRRCCTMLGCWALDAGCRMLKIRGAALPLSPAWTPTLRSLALGSRLSARFTSPDVRDHRQTKVHVPIVRRRGAVESRQAGARLSLLRHGFSRSTESGHR